MKHKNLAFILIAVLCLSISAPPSAEAIIALVPVAAVAISMATAAAITAVAVKDASTTTEHNETAENSRETVTAQNDPQPRQLALSGNEAGVEETMMR